MTTNSSLRTTCLAGGEHPVALVSGQAYTANHLRQQALGVAAALAKRHEQRWALWLTSPYEFLVAFLALGLAGKDIILPGNMQQGTAELLAPHFDGLLSREIFKGLSCIQLAPDLGETEAGGFVPCIDGDVAVTLFTSGSSGEPKAVVKRLALLEAELNVQQRQWGQTLRTTSVLSTVSHQHIYGLLHAVLWPFLRGAPFVDEACQYPEELVAKAELLESVVLVSSPTHLTRLPQAPVFSKCKSNFRTVFSSGGLLDAGAALALAEIVGQAPIEILGSIETGGVAWRQQRAAGQSQSWMPLPSVNVYLDADSGCLAVTAPHLGEGNSQVMGDRVNIHADGSFDLLGRADKVVKVEGKRLSISEMERHLQVSDLIAEARVAVVRAKREEVGAVMVLSEVGQLHLAVHGKLALNRILKKQLLNYFEPPVLPRRWRYIAELPYSSQGKVAVSDIERILLQKVEEKLEESR